MKLCLRCRIEKPDSEFHRNRNLEDGLVTWCKSCYSAYRKENIGHIHRSHRIWFHNHRYDKYGISNDEYMEIFRQQSGVCKICHNPETTKDRRGKIRLLVVDHDHVTGKVRGLLCHDCNHGVGCFHDNISIIERALQYLEEDK